MCSSLVSSPLEEFLVQDMLAERLQTRRWQASHASALAGPTIQLAVYIYIYIGMIIETVRVPNSSP